MLSLSPFFASNAILWVLNRTHCPLDEPVTLTVSERTGFENCGLVWRLLPSNPVTWAPDHSEEQLFHGRRTY